MKNKSKIIIGIVVLLGLGGVTWAAAVLPYRPDTLDGFAKCIKDSGATFYGAFWCPHCQATKAMFGKSAKKLPYIECSKPSGKGQLKICTDAGVEGYPTWVFPDGTRLSGERTIAELAAKTNCQIDTVTQ